MALMQELHDAAQGPAPVHKSARQAVAMFEAVGSWRLHCNVPLRGIECDGMISKHKHKHAWTALTPQHGLLCKHAPRKASKCTQYKANAEEGTHRAMPKSTTARIIKQMRREARTAQCQSRPA